MIGAIVLAAGMAKRMGSPKQLLPFGTGTILGTVVDKVWQSDVDVIVVVLGYEAEEISRTLPDLPMLVVRNTDYALGLSTSIRAGLEAFICMLDFHSYKQSKSGVLLVLGDQPWLTPELVNGLIQEFRQSGDLVAPFFQGRRGNPVLFGEEYFPQLFSLRGDQGAKEILKEQADKIRPVEVPAQWIFHDIDTPEDYQKAIARR